MWNEHLFIVIAIDHYNPLGVIRSLGENGIRPIYISIKGKVKIASYSKYLQKTHFADSVEAAYKVLIKEYGGVYRETKKKPFVLCSDDKTISLLDYRYNEIKDLFYFFNAGETGRINKYMNKKAILELADKHGLNVLKSVVCEKGQLPTALRYPVITKSISPISGGWKSDVFVCKSETELLNAYKNIESTKVLIQEYIEKKTEIAIEGFSANSGANSFFAISSKYLYTLPNYYSPYMECSNVEESLNLEALRRMLKEIQYTGIFEIEFLVDKDDKLWFLEVNFRNSTWSYASTVAGMPLPVLWAETEYLGKLRNNITKKIPKEFTAMVEPIDYEKRVKTGKISLGEWLADFKNANCGFYYNKLDIEPFYEMVKNRDLLG